jgi:3-hydroxybutyryl-CoA dehydrogenase
MIKHVGVLGAGQMGGGIAHVFAQAGYEVVLFDIAPAQLEKSLKGIEKNLGRQAEKGAVDAAAIPGILGRIRSTQQMEDLSGCDIAIEAVTEREELKLDIFRKLDGIVKEGAILASNTSSIPITRIATVTKRPEKVIGMHFMNPVPVMKLVEVIRGLSTSDETFRATSNCCCTTTPSCKSRVAIMIAAPSAHAHGSPPCMTAGAGTIRRRNTALIRMQRVPVLLPCHRPDWRI